MEGDQDNDADQELRRREPERAVEEEIKEEESKADEGTFSDEDIADEGDAEYTRTVSHKSVTFGRSSDAESVPLQEPLSSQTSLSEVERKKLRDAGIRKSLNEVTDQISRSMMSIDSEGDIYRG